MRVRFVQRMPAAYAVYGMRQDVADGRGTLRAARREASQPMPVCVDSTALRAILCAVLAASASLRLCRYQPQYASANAAPMLKMARHGSALSGSHGALRVRRPRTVSRMRSRVRFERCRLAHDAIDVTPFARCLSMFCSRHARDYRRLSLRFSATPCFCCRSCPRPPRH